MGRKNFKAGALTAPLPAVMVTVGDMETSNIITVGWTGILSTVPPRTYVSVRPERYSHGLIKQSGEFVINLTTARLAYAADYAGIYTGEKVDKFRELKLTKLQSKTVAPPTIAECPLALECRVVEVIPMGTHDVFIADIVSVSCDEDILDSDGKIRFDKAELMAYAHGEYYALGEKLGKFGFSAAKRKKKSKPVEKKPTRSAGASGDAKPSESRKSDAKPSESRKGKNKFDGEKKDGKKAAFDSANTKGAEEKRPFYADIRKGKKRGRR